MSRPTLPGTTGHADADLDRILAVFDGLMHRLMATHAPELSAIDYAADLSERLASAEGERMERYWTERLGGTLPVLALPTDLPRPPVQRYAGEAVGFDLGRKTSDAVREIARRADTTPYVVLLTCSAVGAWILLEPRERRAKRIAGRSTTQ